MCSGIRYSESPVDGKIRLQLRDGLSDESLKEIVHGEYDVLWLYFGNFEDLVTAPLQSLKLKHLVFQSSEPQDVSWISSLIDLLSLDLKGRVSGKIDFSELQKLRQCSLDWGPATKRILDAKIPLKSLELRKFSGHLEDFPEAAKSSLQVLGLSGSLESIDGIETFNQLEKVSFSNMTKLRDISKISACKTMKELHIEACNSIENLNSLKNSDSLEKLYFGNKVLPSLDILPRGNLSYIRLGGSTLIEDRNVETALEMKKLKKISYPMKKGYKYSAEDLNSLISAGTT